MREREGERESPRASGFLAAAPPPPPPCSTSTSLPPPPLSLLPQPTDSTPTKLWGALANASVFVLGVAGITFALAAAFRRGWTRAIYAYLAWSGFSLFFFLGGDIGAQLLSALSLPVDAPTFLFSLWNFAATGVAVLFVLPSSPLAARQAFCIATGIGTAYIFCHVAPWTTWALLGAMAVYDLWAVLGSGGPLKALVELAAERGEEIPALIYEGRSTRPRAPGGGQGGGSGAASARPPSGDELGQVRRGGAPPGLPLGVVGVGMADTGGSGAPSTSTSAPRPPAPPSPSTSSSTSPTDRPFPGLPDAIKLGLGDFIFYSVLVGRAAAGDMVEAGAAYLGVIAGLGATLAALALRQHALPALPVSIALGMACTAGARWVVEPVVMPLATSLLFF